jgi:hypothetical protein
MKANHFIKLFVLLLVCCAILGCSPEEEKLGTIYGTVTDFSSGEPINNVNVRLNPKGETTLTGMDGTFEFVDLPSGSYSLSLSKNGYVDLDDDYVIEIENGSNVQRSVQLQKLHYSLQIVDNEGHAISVLDFGIEEGVTQKTFNISNDGNMALDFTITKTANWVEEVVPSTGRVNIGDAQAVTVRINRDLLSDGENNTGLVITTPNLGGVEVVVKATKPVLPSVVTNDITNVTPNSAKCGGNVTADGGVAITSRGVCYSKTSNPTISDLLVNGGIGTGSYTCSLTGLEQNMTYYVRAYATNSVGTEYGIQKSFKTNGGPTVTTGSVSNITSHSAICSGNVTADGGSSVTSRGICWSTAPNPTINSSSVTNGSGLGSFSCEMTNLQNNTTYYVRAYAENSVGVSYGVERTFTTQLLPTFQCGGYTYYVAPDPGEDMYWSDADTYCNNLTIFGMSGWRLPTTDELVAMYADRYSIGGFSNKVFWWSGTYAGNDYGYPWYYYVSFNNGSINSHPGQGWTHGVRPIRRKD